jgi:hypothetical protein
MKKIISDSFPSRYEYTINDNGILNLETRTTYFNEGQMWPILNSNIGYLSIAKNMSTSFIEFLRIQNLLCDHYLFARNRNTDNDELNSINKKIVFLRGPCERYMSGLTEWITMKFGADTATMSKQSLVHIIQALIDIPDIDEHTIEQIHYFRDLDLSKFTVFMLDDTFSEQQLFDWMKDNGVSFRNDIETVLPKQNRTQDHEVKKRVYDIIQSVCIRHQSYITHKCKGDDQLLLHFKDNNQIINDSKVNYV